MTTNFNSIVTAAANEQAPKIFREMLGMTPRNLSRNIALNTLDHLARDQASIHQYGDLDFIIYEDDESITEEDRKTVETFIRVFREYATKRMDEMRIFLKAA